jgi:hypothetical protein
MTTSMSSFPTLLENFVSNTALPRWRQGRGYLRRGKWSGGERVVIGRGECVHVK